MSTIFARQPIDQRGGRVEGEEVEPPSALSTAASRARASALSGSRVSTAVTRLRTVSQSSLSTASSAASRNCSIRHRSCVGYQRYALVMSQAGLLNTAGAGYGKAEGASLPNKKAIGWPSKYICTLPSSKLKLGSGVMGWSMRALYAGPSGEAS